MKQEPGRLKVANSLNGQALKQVTTIADCRAVHVANLFYFNVNHSAIRQKKGKTEWTIEKK